MKLLFCGDVVGQTGRLAVQHHIPQLKRDLGLDFIVVNGENAAGGFGVTEHICDLMREAGVDVITGGDHIFDQREVATFIDRYEHLLRPENFPEHTPGVGARTFDTADGKTVLVVHVMAQLFMRYTLDNPFTCVDEVLKMYELGSNVDAIIVDIHGEATSEKMAMGHYLDGRVSLVVGTHTHVPTADAMILKKGTAYQTDAGMCGDYNSVIGFDARVPVKTFIDRFKTERMTPANGDATVCGVYVETDDATGLATNVQMLRVGGMLSQALPVKTA